MAEIIGSASPNPEPTLPKKYFYHRGQRGIFCEIYFPRRIMAQGTIFDALEKGYCEEEVRGYLGRNVEDLLEELQDYWQIFDPNQYKNGAKSAKEIKRKDALERIKAYQSPFFGWSDYVVNGRLAFLISLFMP